MGLVVPLHFEEEDDGQGREGGGDLERQYEERLFGRARQPREREERYEQHLEHQPELEEVRGRPLICVRIWGGNAVQREICQDEHQHTKRQCYRNPGARPF